MASTGRGRRYVPRQPKGSTVRQIGRDRAPKRKARQARKKKRG